MIAFIVCVLASLLVQSVRIVRAIRAGDRRDLAVSLTIVAVASTIGFTVSNLMVLS